MRRILILLFFTGSFGVFSQGINFEHDTSLAQLKAKAKKLNKPIFIDCYTTWCGPCKWMVKNVFPNDTVGRYFNENFICAKIDMEKGDGKNIGTRYKVRFYPTSLFLDSTGKELHRDIGAKPVQEFVKMAQTANDANRRLSTLKEKYKSGNRDLQFIQDYIFAANAAGDADVQDVFYWYMAMLPKDKLVTTANFELIQVFCRSMDNPVYTDFTKNKDAFTNLVGKKKTDQVTSTAMYWSMMKCYKDDPANPDGPWLLDDEKKFLSLMKEMRTTGIDTIELVSEFMPHYYLAKGNKNAYFNTLRKCLPLCCWNDASKLNEKAWEMYEKSTDKNDLLLALDWSKRSIELDDNYYYNDTYAALCYKLKNKKDALKHQQKAIELGEKSGEDVKDAKERLELIKKMK
ncbi:MAG TPA: thioredoxin family protein [Flavobacteriales bacterium]|nr:thioredoxin family protein [Flavobacteriales bacterium]